MKISTQKNTPSYQLPTVKVTGPLPEGTRPPKRWETGLWLRTLATEFRPAITKAGYGRLSARFNTEKSVIELTFEGDTYSREHRPPLCITGDTKFVDKFGDLAKLDEVLITKVWVSIISFLVTLPQPGDRGFDAYMALHTDYEKLDGDMTEAEDGLLHRQLANLVHENQKLKTEFESVKAQLAEAKTALKVLTGLGKN